MWKSCDEPSRGQKPFDFVVLTKESGDQVTNGKEDMEEGLHMEDAVD